MPSRTTKDRPKSRGVAPTACSSHPMGVTISAACPFSPADGAVRAHSLRCRKGLSGPAPGWVLWGTGLLSNQARRTKLEGAPHMWPDMFLCGLTGVQNEHGGRVTDSRESFQEGVTSELGFEVHIEVRQADNEGRVFHVKRPACVKLQKHYMSSIPCILLLLILWPPSGRCYPMTWAGTARQQTLALGN